MDRKKIEKEIKEYDECGQLQITNTLLLEIIEVLKEQNLRLEHFEDQLVP